MLTERVSRMMLEDASVASLIKFTKETLECGNVETKILDEGYGQHRLLRIGPPFNLSIPMAIVVHDYKLAEKTLIESPYGRQLDGRDRRVKAMKRFGIPKKHIGRKR